MFRYTAPAAASSRKHTHRQTDRQFSEVSSFRKKSYKSLSGEGERDTRTTHTVRQGRDMTEREGGHCCRVIQYSGYSVDFSSLGSKKTSVDYEEDDAAMPATTMQVESYRCIPRNIAYRSVLMLLATFISSHSGLRSILLWSSSEKSSSRVIVRTCVKEREREREKGGTMEASLTSSAPPRRDREWGKEMS